MVVRYKDSTTDLKTNLIKVNSIMITLHKKRSLPLRISSVNVIKSAGNCGFGHIY